MNKFSVKLDAIEDKVNENALTVSIINKVAWVATTAMIAATVKFFWM
jgi:hypothetical protein